MADSDYLGFDLANDPVAQEVIRRRGGTSSADLEAYGQVAGAVGGTAACAALGVSAAIAPLCGYLGGKLGSIIGAAIPIARGAGMQELVADTWNNYTSKTVKVARARHLAVRSALTLRDALVTELANRYHVDKKTADAEVTRRGAYIFEEWRPGQFPESTRQRLGRQATADQNFRAYQWLLDYAARKPVTGYIDEQLKIARDLGLLPAYSYPAGPPLEPTSPISWDSIGYDDFAIQKADALIARINAIRAEGVLVLSAGPRLTFVLAPADAQKYRVNFVPKSEQTWRNAALRTGGAAAGIAVATYVLAVAL